MDLFRVRLDCVDHCQASPTRFDPQLRRGVASTQLHKEPNVPVIRVFGSTETGQKVCAHIHGAFPYLYIEYEGGLTEDEVGDYIHKLHISIDNVLNASYRKDSSDAKPRFVARITLVKGIPFYGFHVGYQYYLKIYALNPMAMTRLTELLRQGAIMDRKFQPYEAHIPYILQWMADFNLYGCGFIDCKKAYFREPVPNFDELSNPLHLWHDRSIPSEYLVGEDNLPRASRCSIEVDVMVQDILNRLETKPRPLHHDFIEHFNPPPPDQKLVHSMAGLWKDETRRRKANMSQPEPGSSPLPPEALMSMSAGSRNSQPGGWIHEEEYMDIVHKAIREEREVSDGSKLSFATYVKREPFESSVKTAFESVQDLFSENLAPVLGLRHEKEDEAGHDESGNEVVEANEDGLDIPEDDEESYESDEDIMREVELSQENILDASDRVSAPKPLFTNDLVKDPPHEAMNPSGSNYLKRSTSDLSSNKEYSKRHRIDMASTQQDPVAPVMLKRHQSSGQQSGFGNPKDGRVSKTVEYHHSTQAPRSPTVNGISHKRSKPRTVSGEDIARGRKWGEQPLSFPIVKNPQEPSTIARLSQGNPSQAVRKASQSKEELAPSNGAKLASGTELSESSQENASPTKEQSKVLRQVLASMKDGCEISENRHLLAFGEPPPTSAMVTSSLQPPVIYQGPYYSNEADVPERAREWAGREFKLESLTVPYLPDFDATAESAASHGKKLPIVYDKAKDEKEYQRRRRSCTLRVWEFGEQPPSYEEVLHWQSEEDSKEENRKRPASVLQSEKSCFSQIDGPTQKNKHGLKFTQPQKTSSVQHQAQYMSVMSLEVHVNTRGDLVPNPEEDAVQCVFWCLQSEESSGVLGTNHVGIVALSENGEMRPNITKQAAELQEEPSEIELLIRVIDIVREHDPDILTGYEIHGSSWGYLIERARLKYEFNLCDALSRMESQSNGRFGKDSDRWGLTHASAVRVTGRHMINIWRSMRSELNLLQYTMENVVFHLLHRRIPHYAWRDLTDWYTNGRIRDLAKVLEYYTSRVQLNLEILEQNELITRTSEQARLLGVDFFSVLSRGSQFKVESLMFRIAKPENFMLVSPSRKQVGAQNALECLPLVMEPQSAFYSSPVLVLDFQSLYPSIVIAYNYCYSTFLGRVVNWRGASKMGFTEYKRQERLLELLKDYINISPNGMMYSKPEVRKSLLSKMLGEILETRVMVKSGMKRDPDDKALQRLLNNRQLALKLIANVTYGYTSASFSGRMPCSEIADSIVQSGRETLEKAIALIHSVKRWGAEVVYGDTDSIFVHLKGRTKDQAFDIGNEIAERVTDMNPRPMKLKFEKVYFPCVLLAKKRYVGFKYEKRHQEEPDFDAKGIETVRRDGTPAEQKIEEKALKLLFRTSDLSQVKSYFQAQCQKIMAGSVSIQDFCFAREVKLGTYSDRGPPPPGALISTKRIGQDHRAEPQYGERVPYVVITGWPGARLIDRCVSPETLLNSDHSELDAEYYISKNIIPPLERIFNLVGANVRAWYDEVPKFQRVRRVDANPRLLGDANASKKTLESYMKSSSCLVCREKPADDGAICAACLANRPVALLAVQTRLMRIEKRAQTLEQVCQSCSGFTRADEVKCNSNDCPVFYSRVRERAKVKTERNVAGPLMALLQEDDYDRRSLEW